MSARIKKAVVPVAGLGTRFLPATKTVPKELLPIVDRPILLHIVEEAVAAGVEQVVLVTGRGKGAIEDFFDTSYEVEDQLARTGKLEILQELKRIRELCDVVSIRQKAALGLGHAVLSAKPVIGDHPFALLLGDEIMVGDEGHPSAIGQLIREYEMRGCSTVAVMPVSDLDVGKYGIVEPFPEAGGGMPFRIRSVVEKPSLVEAPSRWALPGRYVFEGAIFKHLQNTQPGRNGEIQLTDGMTSLAQTEGLWGLKLAAERFDAGDRLGYVIANIEFALRRKDLSEDLLEYLRKRVLT